MRIHLIRIVLLTILSGAEFSQAQEPRLVLPIGHTAQVVDAAFSLNANWVITASADGTAKIWDASTGIQVTELKGHKQSLVSAGFSPDGNKIVTSSYDKTAKIWDAASGELLLNIKEITAFIPHFAFFSPDGGKLATLADFDNVLKIWDASTGKPIANIPTNTASGKNVASFSPDGNSIATIVSDTIATIWKLNSGTPSMQFVGHDSAINHLAFSPDGKQIVTCAGDNTARIWDVASGNTLFILSGHQKNVRTASFSRDGQRLVTTASDYTAKLWDLTTGKCIRTIGSEETIFQSAEISARGNRIVTTRFYEYPAQLWDTAGALIAELHGHTEIIKKAVFSEDGNKIITASWDGTAKIWDAVTGNLLTDLTGQAHSIKCTAFSPDSRYVATASGSKNPRIWDLRSGRAVLTLVGHVQGVNCISYSPDGKKIVTCSDDHTIKIWDAANGEELLTLAGHKNKVFTASFSGDGNKILTTSRDLTGIVWDSRTGKQLVRLRGLHGVASASFSPDGKLIVSRSSANFPVIWKVRNGRKTAKLKGHTAGIYTVTFSPDGTKIVSTSFDKTAKIWDTRTGKLLANLTGHGSAVNAATFYPDGKQLATASWDGTVKIWDANTGEFRDALKILPYSAHTLTFSPDQTEIVVAPMAGNLAGTWNASTGLPVATLSGHTNWVKSAVFSPDGKTILTSAEDYTCKIWDAQKHNLIYTFFAIGDHDYFVRIPTGYYQCTPGAAKLLHYVTPDLKVVTFEQLDVKYNRPDLVLQALGNRDATLVRSYYRAWQKRIKTLGVDTTAFRSGYSVPVADFQNRKTIQYEQKQSFLKLHVRGSDAQYSLDRYNIWVNEVPFFGQRGQTLRKGNTRILDTVITVPLSFGENRIEMSVMNTNGTESYRMPLFVKYTPLKPDHKKVYFVGIGMDRFADAAYNLNYSSKDIRDLAVALKKRYGDTLETDTLFNENVSGESVAALKLKLQKTTVNDKVIVAYSGHGLLSKELDYYLSTYQVDFVHPEKNGLPYEALENLLDSIPARQKLMLIDACHSGEVDKEEGLQMAAVADSLGLARGAAVSNSDTATKHLGLGNSFELMQELFVNVGKGTGATVISASAGTQFALEKGDLKNGVFTYSILEAMNNNPTMLVSQLKSTVGKRVVELTGGMQKPTSRNEIINSDWRLW